MRKREGSMKTSLIMLLVFGLIAIPALIADRVSGRGHARGVARVAAGSSNGGEDASAESRAEGEQPDFINVYADAERVSGLGKAASRIAFNPVAPSDAGTPRAIIVHGSVRERGRQGVAFTYDDPSHGRFVVREEPVRMTQQGLEALPGECAAASLCEGTWKMVTLVD